MSAPKRARSKKEQLEMLIDFILWNPVTANLRINPSNAKESRVIEEKWNEVTTLLNSSGLGPEKEKSEWKRVRLDLSLYRTFTSLNVVYGVGFLQCNFYFIEICVGLYRFKV